jgi:hypothetical protein
VLISPLTALSHSDAQAASATPGDSNAAECDNPESFVPLAPLPKTIVLTFLSIAPKLIVHTHHDAIAGPYHRTGTAILDVMHAFGGSDAEALETIRRHKVGLVLTCPGSSEANHYLNHGPNSFYGRLVAGKQPEWLSPVPLNSGSPFKLWRVKSSGDTATRVPRPGAGDVG